MHIHKVIFSNFYSFADEAEIDFTSSEKKASNLSDDCCGQYVNRINGIFGANGSGKTSALKAIAFIDFFVHSSFKAANEDEDIAMSTHELHKNEPSSFTIEYSEDEYLYKYDFTIHKGRLLNESYKYINPKTNKFNTIYKRTIEDGLSKMTCPSPSLMPQNYNIFNLDNSSLSSFIFEAEKNEILEKDFPIFFNSIILKLLEKVLKNIDLGIESLEIQSLIVLDGNKQKRRDLIFAEHKDAEGNSFTLPIFEESTGTQKILSALWHLIPVLVAGGTAVYDELDSDLHPYLMPFIVDLFMNPDFNIAKGQLIFSGHTIEALKELNKSQIFFVEKSNLRSDIYRADEIEGLRADHSISNKYLKGALGGVPEIDASSISIYEIIDEITTEE